MAADFEHAQRRAAPLLSAMVSSSDNVFEVAQVGTGETSLQQPSLIGLPPSRRQYAVSAVTALDELPFGTPFQWDRVNCRFIAENVALPTPRRKRAGLRE
jgi:hypothetical protein